MQGSNSPLVPWDKGHGYVVLTAVDLTAWQAEEPEKCLGVPQ